MSERNSPRMVSSATKRQFEQARLLEFQQDANQICENIKFIIHSSGEQLDELGCNSAGLDRVESYYRDRLRQATSPVTVEEFERMMAVLLGEAIIAQHGGHWAWYRGKYHVFHPIGVQLPDGKFVDVFLFCMGLSQKSSLPGPQALSNFLNHADKRAIP